jgi:SPX domain protein involved in polyphosphate accumulation
MPTEIIKRRELKVIRDSSYGLSAVKHELQLVAEFPERRVNSLYFDDINYSDMNDNLAGIGRRKKQRLRWYGDTTPDALHKEQYATWEIKSRDGVMSSKATEKIIIRQEMPINAFQIGKLLSDQHASYSFHEKLIPVLFCSYLRNYFLFSGCVRVTIDRKINYAIPMCSENIKVSRPQSDIRTILEIKFDVAAENKAKELLQFLNLRPQRHSKYVHGLAMHGMCQYF